VGGVRDEAAALELLLLLHLLDFLVLLVLLEHLFVLHIEAFVDVAAV
jgi:hypothetical protein